MIFPLSHQAKRWHRDGLLRLDDHDSVEGQSPGSLRSLDISQQPTYVGGMPTKRATKDRVLSNLGLASVAFRGCIRRFKIGFKEVKIQSRSDPMALRTHGLSECSSGGSGGGGQQVLKLH